jgi:hypothetical protein
VAIQCQDLPPSPLAYPGRTNPAHNHTSAVLPREVRPRHTDAHAALAMVTGVAWWHERQRTEGAKRLVLGLMLAAAAVFTPCAAYWGLLVP